MKISAESLLKLSRQEIGALKSYVDGLEDIFQTLRKRVVELETSDTMFSKNEKRKILLAESMKTSFIVCDLIKSKREFRRR